jgi:cyclopropane fatty-acyl-phospholipid synthase-like methyltransferase
MSTITVNYNSIVQHYESCLDVFGDNHRGVDWPNEADAETRYRVMLELIREGQNGPVEERTSLLDFGCGAGHMLEYMRKANRADVDYVGLDMSRKFIELCRQKFPSTTFICADILELDTQIPTFDYVVMNGVFTEKRALSFAEMFNYFRDVVRKVFPTVGYGMAFNVMSKHVDWERDDLFHLPFDMLAEFLRSEISRNYQFRADYGLYEYTCYVYR